MHQPFIAGGKIICARLRRKILRKGCLGGETARKSAISLSRDYCLPRYRGGIKC